MLWKVKVILSVRDRTAALRRTHKQSLLLSRARVLDELKKAQNESYSAQRQRALKYLDAELCRFGVRTSDQALVIANIAEDEPARTF